MRQLSIMVALCVIGISVPWSAAAEECQYHVIKFNLPADDAPEPPPGYDACDSFSIRGTLKGHLITCIKWVDIFTSDDIWADGITDKWVFKTFDWFETSDGEIFMDSWITFRIGEPFLSTGPSEITGGTEAFEGATGVLMTTPKLPNREDVLVIQGYICTPDD